ncbi:MAG: NAD(P)H-dependent oxidoreductase [Kiritimatiellae bacterium]|nr:NAD(P)H-dependent oxidoreductase [Kiritimatiellia bacterium]MDW8457660.1 NAD(P)H-dependent oxidoreductase [Verrucomicrobiota bacterium]
MPTPIQLVAFSGSIRADSLNHKLALRMAEGAREAGASVNVIRLRDYPLPLYDADIQAASGLPPEARRLKAIFRESHGFIIASPEYNGSFSGVLKNMIDWVSRADAPGEPSNAVFAGKLAVIGSASPGAFGGVRGLISLRMLLAGLGLTVLPDQVIVPNAGYAFAPDGRLAEEALDVRARSLGASLARAVARWSP